MWLQIPITAAAGNMLQHHGAGLSGLPFSRMAGFDGLLFCSGQVALDRVTGEFTTGDAAAQSRVIMNNMFEDLREAGLDWRHVLKVTVFVVGMEHAAPFHALCETLFSAPFPAVTCVGVKALPNPKALVEVELIVSQTA